MPVDAVHACLEALYAATDGAARVAHDPVRFAHRYPDPADAEVAGLVAVSFAYGAVGLFLPVLERVFTTLDQHGGPRRALQAAPERLAADLGPIVYRWNNGLDVALLLGALHHTLGDARIASLFEGSAPLQTRLGHTIDQLRAGMVARAPQLGIDVTRFADLPRGARYLLPHPDDGSACKRWVLYLRWMVRSPREGVDLGLWTSLRPAELVMPVDVHVARLSRFLGLTGRSDAGWRTAQEITERLRAYDPDDPVRFDFALAHLGISDACLGYRAPEVCAGCALEPVCRAPTSSSRRGP